MFNFKKSLIPFNSNKARKLKFIYLELFFLKFNRSIFSFILSVIECFFLLFTISNLSFYIRNQYYKEFIFRNHNDQFHKDKRRERISLFLNNLPLKRTS